MGPRANLDQCVKVSPRPPSGLDPRTVNPLANRQMCDFEVYVEGGSSAFDRSEGLVASVTLPSSVRLTPTLRTLGAEFGDMTSHPKAPQSRCYCLVFFVQTRLENNAGAINSCWIYECRP
jgi:hypothetical protein